MPAVHRAGHQHLRPQEGLIPPDGGKPGSGAVPSPPASPTDAALLGATAAGDHDAFAAFVARHSAVAYRHLLALGASPADAEDALQETFVAAWRGAAGFRGPDGARGWLLTIARHALRRAHRPRAGEPAAFAPIEAADAPEATLESVALETGWGALEAAVGGDDAAGDAEAVAARVQGALASLDDGDRDVLTLRDLEGLSGEETAAALGVTVAAMKSRLHRARLRFAAAYRKGGGAPRRETHGHA